MLQKHENPVEKSVSSSSHRLQRRLTEPMGQGVFFFVSSFIDLSVAKLTVVIGCSN